MTGIKILLITGFVILMSGAVMSAETGKYKMCLLKVEGMKCENCVNTVKTTLQAIKGVKEVKVSLEKKEAIVKFDNGIDTKILLDAVNAKGYKATLKGDQITLDIKGMHCSRCANEVKDVLEKQPGVLSADVSFDKKEAVVTCQPGKITLEQLVRIIEDNTEYKAKGKN